jgi:hypothetical protein
MVMVIQHVVSVMMVSMMVVMPLLMALVQIHSSLIIQHAQVLIHVTATAMLHHV